MIWAVLCEGTSTDQETNNVSLFNILEEIHFPEPPDQSQEPDRFPITPVRFTLMALFSRTSVDEAEKSTARLVIGFPDSGPPDILPEFVVDLESAHRNRVKLNFGGLPVRGEGEYRFEIQSPSGNYEWFRLFEIPLQISYLIQE